LEGGILGRASASFPFLLPEGKILKIKFKKGSLKKNILVEGNKGSTIEGTYQPSGRGTYQRAILKRTFPPVPRGAASLMG